MRFRYSTTDPSQDEFDALPRLPLTLYYNNRQIEVAGLVDSGATVNVLPHNVGLQLGLGCITMIVLDTHIWVWWVHGDERLTQVYRDEESTEEQLA